MKKYIFIFGWTIIGAVLISLSFYYKKASDMVVAEVTPNKIAVSFKKAVRVKKIDVLPGQEVDSGQILITVERPDLALDITTVNNKLIQLEIEEKKQEQQAILERRILDLEYKSKATGIDRKIENLTRSAQINKELLSSFESVAIDSSYQYDNQSDIQLIISLKEEKRLAELQYLESLKLIEEQLSANTKVRVLEIEKLQEELKLLKDEEIELSKYAISSGTIGAVSAELGELVPPYKTVISLYGINPSIIKAYINESNRMQLEVGNKVMVTSSNREYTVDGEVIEIGSRIVNYPDRLIPEETITAWGQEIFIRIPSVNNFLNGEKVYVKKQ